MVFRVVIALAIAIGLATVGSSRAATPDFSGTWSLPFAVHSSGVPLFSGQTPWLVGAEAAKNYKILSINELAAIADDSVKNHNGNPTFGMPAPPAPPYTAAGQDAAAHVDHAKWQARELNCYPTNVMMRIGGGSQTVEIVQGKKSLAIASDGGAPARVIYLDGRSQKKAVPQWNGHSVGHWAGDTLKVETVKIRGELMNTFGDWPESKNAKVFEEFSLIQGGKILQVRATYEDPTYYREPLHKIMYLERHPELEVTDYTCEEGKEDMAETQIHPKGVN
jgi:hypothetical protein